MAKHLFNNVKEIAGKFPGSTDSLFVDCYLTDLPDCSSRVFKLYDNLPAHYHKSCDEILYLLQGKAKFHIFDDDGVTEVESQIMEPGLMVTFFRNTAHQVEIIESPVFLSCDTPRRQPDDVHFIHKEETEGVKFVNHMDKLGKFCC